MAHNIRNSFFYTCLILLLVGISGCSVKNKKDSSFTSNFRTKYNILYNSKLLLQQAQKNTEENSTDNLQKPLLVYKEPNLHSIQKNTALMDSVIGKANQIITEKQDSKYVDQAFLIKGRASYLKGDFFNANELFDYIRNNAENNPALQQEARLRQIRSLIQLDNLNEAANCLKEAITHSEENKYIKNLLYATHSAYLLSINNKDEAINQLTKAIEFSTNKKNKRRWQYLLGQLLFEKGENELAYYNFNAVAKSNESYEMIFYSNLYRIEILNKDNPTVENKVRLLSKLLRDGKNKNYKGQIYQRIGDTYLADQQLEKAIQHYELASNNTVGDNFQQALNYQKLADLYFDQAEYSKSSFYYDSTLQVLPKENIEYNQLSLKQAHLSSLVNHLTTISYQDSLIMLSKLSPEERVHVVDKIILKNQAMSPAAKAPGAGQPTLRVKDFDPIAQNNDTGAFYFSSSTAISQGYSEFKKQWGNRELGDNWRYSNRPTSASSSETSVATLTNEAEYLENSHLDLHAKYLDNLPDTPEKLKSSESSIKNAYLSLAEIYQNDLQDEVAAINTYETYLSRFPKDENTALLYFHLYRLYIDSSPEESRFYKEKLLSEFPSSKYSLVLNDPDYNKKQQDLLQNFNEHYNTAYTLFSAKRYNELIQQSAEVIQDKKFSLLEHNMAQLTYLQAIAVGRTKGVNEFKTALLSLINDYPKEEVVVPLVRHHLAYIDANKAQFQNKPIALDELDSNRVSFEKEFALTPWPELSYSKEYNLPIVRKNHEVEESKNILTIHQGTQEETKLSNKSIDIGAVTNIRHENSYRDLELFPDSTNYLFVINIMHGSINLSPSRYGIGQFNRGQYPQLEITHQLKNISNENQLLYVGVFSTFAEVKAYEEKIAPLLNSIMKVSEDIYTSFIVTEAVFNTFANAYQVDDYDTIYQTQK